jgi:hypothetical protein
MRIWWEAPAGGSVTKTAGDHLLAPTLLIVMILILGIWASPLVETAQAAALWMADPSGYVTAVLAGN